MSDKDYEAPEVETINSEDHPSVTAAGGDASDTTPPP